MIDEKPGLFDDIESDFDGGDTPARELPPVERIENPTLADVHTKGTTAKVARFPCRKCGGSGSFIGYTGRHLGACFTCKGTGKQKTDPAKARERAKKREEKRLADMKTNTEFFATHHAAKHAWLVERAPRFDFARSLLEAVAKYGALTDGQDAALVRCMEKDAARAVERAERKPDADVAGAGFARMVLAFDTALAAGLKRPKFRVGEYEFSPAKSTSKNPGCIYVVRSGAYLGKITAEGKFFAGRDCTAEDTTAIAAIGADPLAAAVMHGKQTGSCSCCGRHLENEESVQLGIGPICREKWGL